MKSKSTATWGFKAQEGLIRFLRTNNALRRRASQNKGNLGVILEQYECTV